MLDASLSGIIICICASPPVRQRVISALAHQPIRVVEADSSMQLFGIMQRHRLNCILLDSQVCLDGGLLAQMQLRQLFLNAPPLIFLGGHGDDRHQVAKLFRIGASDYIDRANLRSEELLRSLQFAVHGRQKDDAREAEFEALRKRSDFDELTGLYSRRAIEEIGQRLTRDPGQTPFALLLVRHRSHDHRVSMLGPALGKQVMRQLASRLSEATRRDDALGRYDEKTILALLPFPTGSFDEKCIDRISRALQFEFHSDEVSLNVSAALGVANYPEQAEDIATLIEVARADLERQTAGDPEPSDAMSAAIDKTDSATRLGDRRSSPRHKVLKGGKIIIRDAKAVVDCTVRDVSDGGARLRLPGMIAVPQRFEVLIVGEGSARPSRRAWQNGVDLGVAFDQAEPARTGSEAGHGDRADQLRASLVQSLVALPRTLGRLDWMAAALRAIRTRLDMDVAFVSEFAETDRVIRCVDSEQDVPLLRAGSRIPLAEGYCKRIIDGALPELIPDTALEPGAAALSITHTFPIGSHIGVPIKLAQGSLFGTLCCVGYRPKSSLNDRELAATRNFADYFGQSLDPAQDLTAGSPRPLTGT